jgi:hypothetical protein
MLTFGEGVRPEAPGQDAWLMTPIRQVLLVGHLTV